MYLILVQLDWNEEWSVLKNKKSLFFRSKKSVKRRLKKDHRKVRDPDVKVLEGEMINDEQGNLLVCPQCGSSFVDYDFHQKRYRCLMYSCPWIMEKECESGDYSALIREQDFVESSK